MDSRKMNNLNNVCYVRGEKDHGKSLRAGDRGDHGDHGDREWGGSYEFYVSSLRR